MSKIMSGNELRKSFIDFFVSKNHKYFESASLIPDDKTLLLTVAGMVPFKSFFLGEKKAPFKRITTYQKCIRTNDLENVGITPRHHTFFEMLGNFSFGDYFKKEAILWSWEYITEILKLDKERLWVSVYLTDDEAYEIWNKVVGIPKERIVRLGDKDNWWAAGPIGSCGPCSEIYYDTQNMGKNNEELNTKPGDDGDRYLEIWNLVFTEWNRLEDGSLVPLPEKNIDTGAGLERIASIIQGKKNNFETDLFMPIIENIKKVINISKETELSVIAYKIIADHLRASTFLIADGVLPSNEGRGYILKKLIRRAYGSGAILNNEILEKSKSYLCEIVPTVVDIMKEAYPELVEKQDFIIKIIKSEEEKFARTLNKGILLLDEEINKLKEENKDTLSAKDAFKLYDTYGFPFEFTKMIVENNNLKCCSEEEFNLELQKQITRSKENRKSISDMVKDEFIDKFSKEYGETKFLGYDELNTRARILHIREIENDLYELIFDKTVFYATSGGQVSDKGKVYTDEFYADIVDVSKKSGVYIHYISNINGIIPSINEEINLKVDEEKRKRTMKNHTATHILHQALREILGNTVEQAGSQVDDKRLRFDFSYFEAITDDKLVEVEKRVNEIIQQNLEVLIHQNVKLEEAQKMGAKALFTDKYGDFVRVVDILGYSMELCGGTHVRRTSEIGMFNIVSEQGKASGIRRIEAITGEEVLDYINQIERNIRLYTKKFKTDPNSFQNFVNKLLIENKEKTKEIELLKQEIANISSNSLMNEIVEKDGIKFLFKSFENKSIEELKGMLDIVKSKVKDIVILFGSNNNSAVFVSSVSESLVSKYKASELVKKAANMAGGNGGGKPTFAQAGAKEGDKVTEIIKKLREEIWVNI